MKTLVFAIAAVMVSGSMAFAAINDQSVSQQPVNEPDTTQVAQPEEPDSTAQTINITISQQALYEFCFPR